MAAGATYEKVQTTTLVSSQANVTFNTISGSYTDLVLISNFSASGGGNSFIRVGNGSIDTGSNYSVTYMYGDGSSATSGRFSSQTLIYSGDLGTPMHTNIINFQNYSNSTTYKTSIIRDGYSSSVSAWVGLWRNTAAINTISFNATSGTFNTGSTFTLYGIASA